MLAVGVIPRPENALDPGQTRAEGYGCAKPRFHKGGNDMDPNRLKGKNHS